MIKRLILTTCGLLLLTSLISQESSYNLKSKIIPSVISLSGGMFDGISQQLLFHYGDFKKLFPNANNNFWDPSTSWKNKYEIDSDGIIRGEKFPFSSTIFVFTTDGYHLTRTASKLTGIVGATWLIGKKQKWYYYIFDAFIYSVSRGLGFHFSYTILPRIIN